MKPGAIFINAARGTVVDIPALCQAMESGHLSGAAIDVFPTEPKPMPILLSLHCKSLITSF